MDKNSILLGSRSDSGKTLADIDEDVPLPERQHYPFMKMEIGESFLLNYSVDRKRMATRARGAAAQVTKRHKRQFSVRVVADGVRVWRTR